MNQIKTLRTSIDLPEIYVFVYFNFLCGLKFYMGVLKLYYTTLLKIIIIPNLNLNV